MPEPTTPDTLSPETVQGNLTKQGVAGSLIRVDNNTLEISPPGVPVQNITDFFLNTLGEIPELRVLLSDSLPVGNLSVSHFKFTPTSGDTPYLVEMTLLWADLE